MEKHYTHLSAEERGLIMAERHRGTSGAKIARMLGRSPSTIWRELKRNASCSSTYNASEAGSALCELLDDRYVLEKACLFLCQGDPNQSTNLRKL